MMNFCTYFDSFYMLKGLALYTSLQRVTTDFHLYIMAFDRECYDKLTALNLKYMTVELLSDIETPELLAVKPTRSRGEYCWTCGPSAIYHFLTRYKLDCITYLDSDLMFLSDPHVVVEEVANASIAITEQGIDDQSARTYGKYCVQYMTFRNDKEGLAALSWWRDSCIEWCFNKIETTRFGDQKYLDEFPKRWLKVHVIQNLGVGIAPWNMYRYSYVENWLTYNNKQYPFVFFHMHGVKTEITDKTLHVSTLDHELNNALIEMFYMPYANLLKDVLIRYYGYNIEKAVVHDMPIMKKIEYRVRASVRNNNLVRWIWFTLLKQKNQGHGAKF